MFYTVLHGYFPLFSIFFQLCVLGLGKIFSCEFNAYLEKIKLAEDYIFHMLVSVLNRLEIEISVELKGVS